MHTETMSNNKTPSEDSESDPEYDTYIDPSAGLRIPPTMREFNRQIIIRTPRLTLQHYQPEDGVIGPYYGLVDESHFGDLDTLDNPQNPHLAPNKIRVKPEGEESVTFSVELDPDIKMDGGTLPTAFGKDLEKIRLTKTIACTNCDDYKLTYEYSGVKGTTNHEEVKAVTPPTNCPVCGGEIKTTTNIAPYEP